MKRRLVKLVIFLVIGAITNIAVAWGCAIWSDASFDSLEARNATQKDIELFERVGWILESESENSTSNYTVQSTKGFGVSDSFLIEELLEVRDMPQYSAYSPRLYQTVNIVGDSYQTGWPLRCFSGAYFDQMGMGLFRTAKGKFLQRSLSDEATSSGLQVFYNRRETPLEDWQHPMSLPVPENIGPFTLPADRYIPLRPIWSSFVINSIFYATALWLMMHLWANAQRNKRLKNGHCPSCNYNLRSDCSAGCPECGWGREKPDNAAKSIENAPSDSG